MRGWGGIRGGGGGGCRAEVGMRKRGGAGGGLEEEEGIWRVRKVRGAGPCTGGG